MSTISRLTFHVFASVLGVLMAFSAHAAVDRDKLLKDPGVYGTFAVFKADEEWWKLDKAKRQSAVAEAKEVIQQHSEKVAIDVYLLRGLVERADFFVRVHSTDLLNNQNFLVDLMGTSLGKYLQNTSTFNGLTKKANYVPSFPEDLKTGLKTMTDAGPKPYAIVVPVRKDAEWWITDQDGRTEMMKEHTQAAMAYLKTVVRKLYHSSGLDDLDFVTYFETAKLEDFNNLIISLERVKENRHNRQFGHPTLIGTIRPLDEILEILAR
jgi:chlorite dismutase